MHAPPVRGGHKAHDVHDRRPYAAWWAAPRMLPSLRGRWPRSGRARFSARAAREEPRGGATGVLVRALRAELACAGVEGAEEGRARVWRGRRRGVWSCQGGSSYSAGRSEHRQGEECALHLHCPGAAGVVGEEHACAPRAWSVWQPRRRMGESIRAGRLAGLWRHAAPAWCEQDSEYNVMTILHLNETSSLPFAVRLSLHTLSCACS